MIDDQRSRLKFVVLAAGFSSRLGRPKTLVRVHGEGLLRRTLSVLAQVTNERVLVVVPRRTTRLQAELRDFRVTLLGNAARAGGLSTSVVLALRHANYSSATLFLPADLPYLTPRDLARLIRCWRGSRHRVVARSTHGRASTPLIFPRFLYSKARQLTGDVGLRDFINELLPDQRILVDLQSAVFDVDTPKDLARARRRFAGRSVTWNAEDVVRLKRATRRR